MMLFRTAGIAALGVTLVVAGAAAQNAGSVVAAASKAMGAAANNATVRQQGGQQVVTFSPANFKSPSGQTYSVTGYINNQNLVTKVETRVDNAVVGDLLVEFEYSNYQNMNGVQVPTRIVQRQAGMPTFDATIKSATPN